MKKNQVRKFILIVWNHFIKTNNYNKYLFYILFKFAILHSSQLFLSTKKIRSFQGFLLN